MSRSVLCLMSVIFRAVRVVIVFTLILMPGSHRSYSEAKENPHPYVTAAGGSEFNGVA